jgi:hypothetical protein
MLNPIFISSSFNCRNLCLVKKSHMSHPLHIITHIIMTAESFVVVVSF